MYNVSDDESPSTPPVGMLSATITEMQAKHNEDIYHTEVKLLVLTLCAEHMDSALLH